MQSMNSKEKESVDAIIQDWLLRNGYIYVPPRDRQLKASDQSMEREQVRCPIRDWLLRNGYIHVPPRDRQLKASDQGMESEQDANCPKSATSQSSEPCLQQMDISTSKHLMPRSKRGSSANVSSPLEQSLHKRLKAHAPITPDRTGLRQAAMLSQVHDVPTASNSWLEASFRTAKAENFGLRTERETTGEQVAAVQTQLQLKQDAIQRAEKKPDSSQTQLGRMMLQILQRSHSLAAARPEQVCTEAHATDPIKQLQQAEDALVKRRDEPATSLRYLQENLSHTKADSPEAEQGCAAAEARTADPATPVQHKENLAMEVQKEHASSLASLQGKISQAEAEHSKAKQSCLAAETQAAQLQVHIAHMECQFADPQEKLRPTEEMPRAENGRKVSAVAGRQFAQDCQLSLERQVADMQNQLQRVLSERDQLEEAACSHAADMRGQVDSLQSELAQIKIAKGLNADSSTGALAVQVTHVNFRDAALGGLQEIKRLKAELEALQKKSQAAKSAQEAKHDRELSERLAAAKADMQAQKQALSVEQAKRNADTLVGAKAVWQAVSASALQMQQVSLLKEALGAAKARCLQLESDERAAVRKVLDLERQLSQAQDQVAELPVLKAENDQLKIIARFQGGVISSLEGNPGAAGADVSVEAADASGSQQAAAGMHEAATQQQSGQAGELSNLIEASVGQISIPVGKVLVDRRYLQHWQWETRQHQAAINSLAAWKEEAERGLARLANDKEASQQEVQALRVRLQTGRNEIHMLKPVLDPQGVQSELERFRAEKQTAQQVAQALRSHYQTALAEIQALKQDLRAKEVQLLKLQPDSLAAVFSEPSQDTELTDAEGLKANPLCQLADAADRLESSTAATHQHADSNHTEEYFLEYQQSHHGMIQQDR